MKKILSKIKMTAKHLLICLLSCFVIASVLSGCGKDSGTSASETGESTPSSERETAPSSEDRTTEIPTTTETPTEPTTEEPSSPEEVYYYQGLKNLSSEKVSVEITENMTEIYTFGEGVSSGQYLGEYDGQLYFLGYSNIDLEATKNHGLILAVKRNPQGGEVETIVDLGPFYDECQFLGMVNGKIYLSIFPQGTSEEIPEGGALVAVETSGNVEILKKYENHFSPRFYFAGNSIIYTRLPGLGEEVQTLELYNTETGEWSDAVQRPLKCDPENHELCTGSLIYAAQGMNKEGFYYATIELDSEIPYSYPAPQKESEIWWHDLQTGKDTLITSHDRQVSLSGNAHVLFLLWSENGSRKISVSSIEDCVIQETVTPGKKNFMNSYTRFLECTDGTFTVHTLAQTSSDAVTISYRCASKMDLQNGKITCYEPVLEGWEVSSEFLSSETQDEIICLMKEEPIEGQVNGGNKAKQQFLVIKFDGLSELYEPKDPASATISLDFDKVLAAGQALDEKELEKVTSFLTAGKDDGEAVPWGFVRQTYNDPSEIDISLVYYNKGTEKEVSEEEAAAAYKAMGWEPMGFEAQKRTMDAVKEAFKKYTGKDLTEDQLKAFSVWIYLPEYDAYYSFVTDMPDDIHADQCGRGCRLDKAAAEALGLPVKADEMIAVEWAESEKPGQESPMAIGMVLLVPDGDGYRFAANLLHE